MIFKPFYLGCLAHGSYLIGDGGEAAVVDPQRDVEQYLEEARAQGLTIRHIIETHLHADFVSGHLELARRTGATIHIGHLAGATFPHRPIREGDELRLGGATLRFLETPGHTPEGISVLVFDGSQPDVPRKILTGDTLFVGDVGRPDLVVAKGRSPEEMARMLYHSLHHKILTLPDEVEVWPAHGAGSACGRSISRERSSTIGIQRQANPALRPMDEEAFVRSVTTGLEPAPRYFGRAVEANRRGAPSLAEVIHPQPLDAAAVEARMAAGATVLDVRTTDAYGQGHIPGSVFIGLDGQFASWAGSLLDLDAPIVLVAAEKQQVAEAAMRLARVGIERVEGHLEHGIEAWRASGRPLGTVEQVTVDALQGRIAGGEKPRIVDVRRAGEHQGGHIPGAQNVPLDRLSERWPEVETPAFVACGSGYRSMIACSLLEQRGRQGAINVRGGHGAWTRAGLPVT
jgi:glyoxylase-like metal-dependent hydrolase (beta-lactamase superfamily II)